MSMRPPPLQKKDDAVKRLNASREKTALPGSDSNDSDKMSPPFYHPRTQTVGTVAAIALGPIAWFLTCQSGHVFSTFESYEARIVTALMSVPILMVYFAQVHDPFLEGIRTVMSRKSSKVMFFLIPALYLLGALVKGETTFVVISLIVIITLGAIGYSDAIQDADNDCYQLVDVLLLTFIGPMLDYRLITMDIFQQSLFFRREWWVGTTIHWLVFGFALVPRCPNFGGRIRPHAQDLVLGLLASLVGFLVFPLTYSWGVFEQCVEVTLGNPLTFLLVSFARLISTAIPEEVLFRTIIYGRLADRVPPGRKWIAMLASGAAWGLWTVMEISKSSSYTTMLCVFVVMTAYGFILCQIYRLTDNNIIAGVVATWLTGVGVAYALSECAPYRYLPDFLHDDLMAAANLRDSAEMAKLESLLKRAMQDGY